MKLVFLITCNFDFLNLVVHLFIQQTWSIYVFT